MIPKLRPNCACLSIGVLVDLLAVARALPVYFFFFLNPDPSRFRAWCISLSPRHSFILALHEWRRRKKYQNDPKWSIVSRTSISEKDWYVWTDQVILNISRKALFVCTFFMQVLWQISHQIKCIFTWGSFRNMKNVKYLIQNCKLHVFFITKD